MTDLGAWLKPDEGLRAALDAKDRRAIQAPRDYFTALPDSAAAQAEALQVIADHLCSHFPDTYFRMGPQIDIIPAFRRLRLDDPLTPPLLIAAGLVAEDLILLQKDADHWQVIASAAISVPAQLPDLTEASLDRQVLFHSGRHILCKLPESGAVLMTVRAS